MVHEPEGMQWVLCMLQSLVWSVSSRGEPCISVHSDFDSDELALLLQYHQCQTQKLASSSPLCVELAVEEMNPNTLLPTLIRKYFQENQLTDPSLCLWMALTFVLCRYHSPWLLYHLEMANLWLTPNKSHVHHNILYCQQQSKWTMATNKKKNLKWKCLS